MVIIVYAKTHKDEYVILKTTRDYKVAEKVIDSIPKNKYKLVSTWFDLADKG